MAVSPLDSTLQGALCGDAELGPLFSDAAEIAALVGVERALARAQAACGVVPSDVAEAIGRELAQVTVTPEALAAGTAQAGVVVPALLAALRPQLSPQAAHWLHWGATSQDIEDTGLVLRLRSALDLFEARLAGLAAGLEEHARRWRDAPMAGRTRSQIAAPTSFGLRVARWRAPLVTALDELPELRRRVLRVQLGGAVGSNDALGDGAGEVVAHLARELDLAPAPCWHTDRSGFAALGAWCARVAAALAKIAGDLVLMGRSEIAEARAGAGGGSSTMPQKANPVTAETILGLARFVAALSAPLHSASVWAEERDGAAWTLERLVLPQIVVATGAALGHALELSAALAPDADRMRANLELGGGAALSERAVFALARTMPRAQAQRIVSQALEDVAEGTTLAQALAQRAPGTDWPAVLDAGEVGAAAAATEAGLAGPAGPPER